MRTLADFVAASAELVTLRSAVGLPDVAVVGGALRDWLLGRTQPDLDLAVAGDPELVARALQQRFGGSWYVLDPNFGTLRYNYNNKYT
ncbi:MAG: hypothetical protein KGR26_07750, partial [Cyanobacteria bacterium REEB65]|nr:hypothetical protein [Cyanobacteria bacterium REEB65]